MHIKHTYTTDTGISGKSETRIEAEIFGRKITNPAALCVISVLAVGLAAVLLVLAGTVLAPVLGVVLVLLLVAAAVLGLAALWGRLRYGSLRNWARARGRVWSRTQTGGNTTVKTSGWEVGGIRVEETSVSKTSGRSGSSPAERAAEIPRHITRRAGRPD